MPGHVEFEFSFAKNTPQPSRRGDSLRILMLADFRGAARKTDDHAISAPKVVDIDNFDKRLTALKPAVNVTDSLGVEHHIVFDSLESFHPDEIFARVDAFAAPGESPTTTASEDKAAPAASENEAGEPNEDPFASLLGQSVEAPKQTRAKGMLDSFIKNLVDDDVVPDAGQKKAQAAGASAAHGEQMRALLHDPNFQRLEAAWRGLYDLVSELETGEELSVFMLDVSADGLRADLDADDYQQTHLFRTLVSDDHGRFGGKAWHVIACDIEFEQADMRRLGNLGATAAAAGGIVLAGGDALDGDAAQTDTDFGFADLRSLEVAQHIGLTAPRVLLRLPYGAKSDPIEPFKFEECAGRPGDGELLWGCAAPLLARLLGQTFLDQGWRMSPGSRSTIGERPAYVFNEDGERHLAGVTQQSLNDSAAEALLDKGIIAIVGQRDGNQLLVPRIQSIAEPARALRGAWA